MFQSSWSDFADFERIFVRIKNTISGQLYLYCIVLYCIVLYYTVLYYSIPEYVMQHWKEDFMFGYQFLNGCNPVMIKKCTKLPDKLPVTHEMVSVSLERGLTLEEEIKVERLIIFTFSKYKKKNVIIAVFNFLMTFGICGDSLSERNLILKGTRLDN